MIVGSIHDCLICGWGNGSVAGWVCFLSRIRHHAGSGVRVHIRGFTAAREGGAVLCHAIYRHSFVWFVLVFRLPAPPPWQGMQAGRERFFVCVNSCTMGSTPSFRAGCQNQRKINGRARRRRAHLSRSVQCPISPSGGPGACPRTPGHGPDPRWKRAGSQGRRSAGNLSSPCGTHR